MSSRDHAALVSRVVETIWNRGELDVADALFTPDYVHHGGLIPDLVQGPEAIKVAVALYRAAFPGLHVTVRDVRLEGETVVLQWSADGGRSGGSPGAPPPPGRQLTGVTRSRLAGGQIAESWTQWETPDPWLPLDLVPASAW